MPNIYIKNIGTNPLTGQNYCNFLIIDFALNQGYWYSVQDLAVGLTLAEVQTYLDSIVASLWTTAQLNGQSLTVEDIRKIQLLQDAATANTQIDNTLIDNEARQSASEVDTVTLTGSPTQVQVLSVVRRIIGREALACDRLAQQLNREKEIIDALATTVRESLKQ